MLTDSICILRGFGLFDVGLRAGASGGALTPPLRRIPDNDKETFGNAHIKCPVNDRIRCSAANLRFGSKTPTDAEENGISELFRLSVKHRLRIWI